MKDKLENNIEINEKKACSGCSACYSICPKQAISMVTDKEGFDYPVVNHDKCINCGLCKKVCPLRNQDKRLDKSRYFAVKNVDECTRMHSTSGGVFSILVNYVLEKDGVIYGAAYDKEFRVIHKRASDKSWEEFRGSKYVQSIIGDVFAEVRNDLKNKKWVLFSGTPCQVDGLQKYLEKSNIRRDTLITCDLVCHGVASPLVWQEYLDLAVGNRSVIKFINFRDKNNCGWHDSRFRIYDEKDKYIVDYAQPNGIYWGLFLNNYILRPSCYECHYSNFKRVGDFTLGDYWGIEHKHAEFDDNKGVSLFMVNTSQAQSIWEEIKKNTYNIEVNQGECVQPNLLNPSPCPLKRNQFFRVFRKRGILYAAKYVGVVVTYGIEKYKFKVMRKCIGLLEKIFKDK